MRLYKNTDGEIVQGATPIDVVQDLRDGSWFDNHVSLEAYMVGFAERIKISMGKDVRADNAENFIEDLIHIGYLTQIQ